MSGCAAAIALSAILAAAAPPAGGTCQECHAGLSGDLAQPAEAFADDVLAEGTSYLTMSMVPRYWFYPRIFGDVPGQGAYQSVWLTPTRSEECPVCGSPEHRVEPLEVSLRAPRREAFLAGESDSP